MFTIYIDADAAPKSVMAIVQELATRYTIPYYTVANYHHQFASPHHITVSDGADSADFKIISLVQHGDIVITQDYGLASLVIAKGADVLTSYGEQLTAHNIDHYLAIRAESSHLRRQGIRTKGPRKRKIKDDELFLETLEQLLQEKLAP
ncbi:YaiI/YqxD family protein [Rubeoparvulum massiliense]|uniref:YaiI/YqxD family protein n=1 Tax=Rubeoparvulum massiliense TaxID=1631346 RepID=UPI00065DE481|nr:DUF188 domain-containing protein [Rubeoparvulum massiliense]